MKRYTSEDMSGGRGQVIRYTFSVLCRKGGNPPDILTASSSHGSGLTYSYMTAREIAAGHMIPLLTKAGAISISHG